MDISRRTFHRLLLLGCGSEVLTYTPWTFAETIAVPLQPFAAATQRLLNALQEVGSPLSDSEAAALRAAFTSSNESDAVAQIQSILDAHVLFEAHINPENRVSVSRGMAKAELAEHGWRPFLIKIKNESGTTSSFTVSSPQAEPVGRVSDESPVATRDFTNGAIDAVEAGERWLAIDNWSKPPLEQMLSGLVLEYRLLLLYSRDSGKREASLESMLGEKERDLGFRSTVPVLFDCLSAHKVSLHIRDVDGNPATASLLITDKLHRVYPAQNKRTVPDLWFEKHIYRNDGETAILPNGEYCVAYSRGPEYLTKQLSIRVEDASPLTLKLERWIAPKKWGYYSGDTHIHAAGCSHYESPSEGVTPDVMYRQVRGEALDVGDVLTWGPGYYYQKRFFTGHVENQPSNTKSETSTMRYDVEVSGFPSSHCGHLVLLRLRDQNYPGAATLDQWPSWNIPILIWAKSQGALAGYAHSGHGLTVDSTELPNYLVPPFDSMGANEYIADVTHEGLVAFISGCDTRPFAELNIWYHALNCGYRTMFVGETDFPCLTDERVGGGRTYVQLDSPPLGDEGYGEWISGIQNRSSYFGDGRSHIFEFACKQESKAVSSKELQISGPGKVQVTATVCARLEPEISTQTEKIRSTSPYDKPYWHLERARIGNSRKVPIELIVNGWPVQRKEIPADGSPQPIDFDVDINQSSWIALRILPSSHTNPRFVVMNGAPIRASRKSAQWCRAGVDVCWQQKSKRIRPSEMAAAATAYDHARAAYDRIIIECETE
jgi:hypothetical protein